MKITTSLHLVLISILTLLFALIMPIAAYADLSWHSQTEFRVAPSDSGKESSHTFLQAKLDHALGAVASFSGRIRIHYHASLAGLSDNESGKVELEFKDAYLDLFNFPCNNLELRIGKQRINTGKSDFFRHLDIINPLDLSNPIVFDDRVSSLLIKIKWNIDFDSALEIFTGPGIIMAKYPYKEDKNAILKQQINQTTGISCNFTENNTIPQAQLKHWLAGIKLSAKIGSYDLTLLAVTHYNPLLLPNQISITTASSNCTINYLAQREYILGIGFAGELLGLGIRGELAARKSSSFSSQTYIDSLLVEERSIITDDWYLTGSFGIDYQCKNGGPYINMEFSHGFLGEFRNKQGTGINQYAALSIEQKLNSDRLKITASIGFEFDKLTNAENWQQFKKESAWFTMLGITISISENIELESGGFWANGADSTTLGKPEMASMLYLKLAAKM